MSQLLDTSTVAARYGVAVNSVARWCREGRLPGAFQVGRAWIVPADALEGFEPPKAGRPKETGEPKD